MKMSSKGCETEDILGTAEMSFQETCPSSKVIRDSKKNVQACPDTLDWLIQLRDSAYPLIPRKRPTMRVVGLDRMLQKMAWEAPNQQLWLTLGLQMRELSAFRERILFGILTSRRIFSEKVISSGRMPVFWNESDIPETLVIPGGPFNNDSKSTSFHLQP
jgi:hypothetical protein